MNEIKVEQLDNLPPNSNPFHFDMERMGTQIGMGNRPDQYLMAMYTDRELGRREVILIDPMSGVQIKVKMPMLTWSQLAAVLDMGLFYDQHKYSPYEKKVAEMGKCHNCGKSELGYIGLKRTKYHWKDIPVELHFGLCPDCDSIHFIDVKK